MTNKAEVKPQPRYFYNWKRTNTYDQQRTLDALSIIHSINPSGHAKLISIAEKFQCLFGSIYLPQQSEKVSPLFKFLVWRQMASDYISPDFKRTDYLNTLVDDLTRGYNKFRDSKKIEHITSVANSLYDEFFKDNNFQDLRRNKERVRRLQDCEAATLKRMQDYIDLYNRQIQQLVVLKDQAYVRLQFEQVRKMELLSPWQQNQRWKNFQILHEKSFNCQIVEDKRNRPFTYSLKLNRPSSETEPVLMRVSDWVQLRTIKENNTTESEIFIKDLIEQLKKYHLQTSRLQGKDEEKVYNFYQYVSPQYVLFDQITLRPKLSYEPLLHELFGLKKKSTSIQGYIVWFCTPKEFDYFQGEDELDKEMKLRLADPFHGVQNLYTRTKDFQTVLQLEKQILQRAKESISIDRFLLTSHYLLYGTEFGRPQEHTSYTQIEDQFLLKLQKAKQDIREDASKLSMFVGKAAENVRGRFNFRFGELVQCLSIQEKDSVLQVNRYLQVIRYLNLRYTFIRETVTTLTNENFFHRINNAKKYIMLYMIFGIQYLEELRLICLEGSRTNDIPSFKRYLDDTGKKLKNGKSVEYSLQSTYSKIQNYQNKASQEAYKFLLEEEGKKLIEGCKQLSSIIKLEHAAFNKICNLLEGEQRQEGYKDEVRSRILKSKSAIPKYIQQFRKMLAQFSKVQMKIKHPSGPHKPPDEKNEKNIEYYNIVTRRFELLLHSFLTTTQQNYLIYDSLVARVLHADEKDYPQFNAASPDFLKTEREAHIIVDQIIGFSKLKEDARPSKSKDIDSKKGNSKAWLKQFVI